MASPSPASSLTGGTLYFAFGSNISHTQMSIRLNNSPSSSVPIAIAKLEDHAWIICKRGYANVVALPPASASASTSTSDSSTHESSNEIEGIPHNDRESWGILYDMVPADEARLDQYEGHDVYRNPNPTPNPDPASKHIKPYLQGNWDYNKHYLPITITKWLCSPEEIAKIIPHVANDDVKNASHYPSSAPMPFQVTALVYVDEYRTTAGNIKSEYIGRMNRAIEEGVALDLSAEWVKKVMRIWVKEPGGRDRSGHVGTEKGYLSDE